MGTFSVSITITGIASGLSETMDAVVDAGIIHSVIPSDILARLRVIPDWPHASGAWMPDGTFADLPRGSARARLHVPTDGNELYRDDLCAIVPVLFGPEGGQPILGRTTLSFMDLAADPDNERLIPAEIRIPGDAIVELLKTNDMLRETKDGPV